MCFIPLLFMNSGVSGNDEHIESCDIEKMISDATEE